MKEVCIVCGHDRFDIRCEHCDWGVRRCEESIPYLLVYTPYWELRNGAILSRAIRVPDGALLVLRWERI